jgi:probable HAF family extracellular repeat protein
MKEMTFSNPDWGGRRMCLPRPVLGLLAGLLFGLGGCGGSGSDTGASGASLLAGSVVASPEARLASAGTGQALPGGTIRAAAAPTYRVVQLTTAPSFVGGVNTKGQVAFTEFQFPVTRAKFFDGVNVHDLGTLGGASSEAMDLNDNGVVTGYANYDDSGFVRAFRWSLAGGMVNLGSLPGTAESRGMAINAMGTVAGVSNFNGGEAEPTHAVRWSPNLALTDLGTLNGPSNAVALNDAGRITGDTRDQNGNTVAFSWTAQEGMISLGGLGDFGSNAFDINASGQIAGNSSSAAFGFEAFIWTPGQGMRGVGISSFATGGINDQGMLAGIIFETQHALAWTPQQGAFDIHPVWGAYSTSYALNNRGEVVGGVGMEDNTFRAFRWTQQDGTVDLNTRVVNAPAGLQLQNAMAISDSGRIVCATNNGLVLLVPVE